MKKMLSLLLALLLMVAVVPMGIVSAASTPTIKVDSVVGAWGDTVDVKIALENNPGIMSAKIKISYDANVLELTARTPGSAYAARMSFSKTLDTNPYIVNFVDSINPDVTDSDFVTLTFKVKEGATLGKTNIEATYNQADVCNTAWEDVVFAIENGGVDVISCRHTTETVGAVDPTCTDNGYTGDEVCTKCKETVVAGDVIDALGHDPIKHDAKAPTCTAVGWYVYETCSRCDSYTTYKEIEATGHTEGEAVVENVVAPSCGAMGSYDFACYCVTCKEELSRLTVETARGHKLDKTGKCKACGETVTAPTFFVTSSQVRLGEEVKVDVVIKNNPGIISMKLKLGYDENVLELVGAEGGEFTNVYYGETDKQPFIINWVDSINPDNTTDGVIATITFKVKEDAQLGESTITVDYDAEDVFNSAMENVSIEKNYAIINVIKNVPGDATGDEEINNKDLAILMQYLNEWDVELDVDAVDVNDDGAVNNKDYALLMQYLNEWDVELK